MVKFNVSISDDAFDTLQILKEADPAGQGKSYNEYVAMLLENIINRDVKTIEEDGFYQEEKSTSWRDRKDDFEIEM